MTDDERAKKVAEVVKRLPHETQSVRQGSIYRLVTEAEREAYREGRRDEREGVKEWRHGE